MNCLKNISYFFVPFIYDKRSDFKTLINVLDDSDMWEQIHDEIVYMLKYVAEKIDSYNKKTCQCFHYHLKEASRDQLGLAHKEDWFHTAPHSFQGKQESIRFQILSAELYFFCTTVGIVAFKVCFEQNDPFWVSNAQYYLKKVSREKIYLDADISATTMLDLSKKLVQNLSMVSEIDFFYYANSSTERANVLTYLEVDPKEDYKKELFYLRRCYSEGFLYAENEKIDSEEIYIPSKDTVWGLSPEATVCLACPGFGRQKFIQGTFYKNFNAQYLFMYVLLLHQKYVLYMFLTRIDIEIYNDLDALEEYRNQLYEFETDFVFHV